MFNSIFDELNEFKYFKKNNSIKKSPTAKKYYTHSCSFKYFKSSNVIVVKKKSLSKVY